MAQLPGQASDSRPDLQHAAGPVPAACGTLPYNAATPILHALVESGRFEALTVMVQREVAQRLAAKPGTGAYGAPWGTATSSLSAASPAWSRSASCLPACAPPSAAAASGTISAPPQQRCHMGGKAVAVAVPHEIGHAHAVVGAEKDGVT